MVDCSRKRVLLAEDEEDHARLCAYVLRTRSNCEVVHEKTCAGAVARLNSGNFDLVIVDLKMAECSGLEILKHLKASRSPAKTLVITGLNVSEGRLSDLGYQPDALRLKPLEFGELVRLASDLLEGRHDVAI